MTFVGGWGRDTPYTLFFYGEFDRPARSFGRWSATRGAGSFTPGRGLSAGGDTRAGLDRRLGTVAMFDTRKNPVVQLKFAVSFISMDQARQTLVQQMPDWSFDKARGAASKQWSIALGKIEVEGGTDDQRRTFYSALYRTEVMPHDVSGENVWWRSDEPHYEDFYTIWDTFRTVHA